MVLARAYLKADLRQPITGFGLLDWAYRKECVRAAGEEDWAQLEGHGQSIIARAGNMGIKGMSHGAINGRLDVHIDALRVDEFVYSNCSSRLYYLVTVNAEKGKPMPATISLPRLRVAPKYRDAHSQRMVMIYDSRRHAIGCEIEWVGVPDDEIAKAEAHYAMLHRGFIGLLDALPELVLDKWRVEGRGA